MAEKPQPSPPSSSTHHHSFRRVIVRGLGVVLPPLLTLVIFLWVGQTVQQNVLEPVSHATRHSLAWILSFQVPSDLQGETAQQEGFVYKRLEGGEYVSLEMYEVVQSDPNTAVFPRSQRELISRYVEIRYLKPHLVIPFFFCVFVLLMYLLGKFLAAGIGRFFWRLFEGVILRLPLVRNVYSSVKQVTDFMFQESEIEYTRVVAVEYPRKGIWSLGLVTNEGMVDIAEAAKEPLLTVLIPASPMPVTGYTITVGKSETIDLDITIDQALQYIVSCGVVLPPHQLQNPLTNTLLPTEPTPPSPGKIQS